ncbi:MAG: FprA family A-type flavoprotein [Synergistaceae bacterium]|jgi:flavorubredoxin|nr:FprA family A-type flavoprotein [Synergistaceae bacterium]
MARAICDTRDAVKVADSVFWIGVCDRETDKFEGMWDLPHGMAYNSYLIKAEKTVLIDTVKGAYMDGFFSRLNRLLDGLPLDYAVINHVEPDHSGALALLRRLYPEVKLVGNAKTAEMLKNFYGVEGGFVEVKEGGTLDLGGRRLVFVTVPMVHWPESMVSYDETNGILFSNDIFGGFGAVEGGIFDDEADLNLVTEEMMRYYVNIVGRFSRQALKALEKVRKLNVSMICPAHGPIWRSCPGHVIDIYEKWSRQETEEGVVVVYGSMYGNTKTASDAIARSIAQAGVKPVRVYDASRSNMSFITTDVWKYRGLVLSCCTYNMEAFPPIAALLRLLENKNMTGRRIGLCGTYSWASAALKEMQAFVERSKGGWKLVDPTIDIKSRPSCDDLEMCGQLGKNMAAAVRDI